MGSQSPTTSSLQNTLHVSPEALASDSRISVREGSRLSTESLAALNRSATTAHTDVLASLRGVSGYLGCIVVAGSRHKPVLVDIAQAHPQAREHIIQTAQRYAALAETLFPSNLSPDRTACPREISAAVGEETHLMRCLDADQGIRCVLVIRGAGPQAELARFRLRMCAESLLEQARREPVWS